MNATVTPIRSDIISFQDEELAKKAAGAIVFWALAGDVRLQALDDALTAAESSAIRPDTPSDVVALRRAVEATGKHLGLESHGKQDGTWRLVAPGSKEEIKEDPNAFNIGDPAKRKKSLIYDVKLTARLAGEAKTLEVENLTANDEATGFLRQAMEFAKDVLPPQDMSAWLCDRLAALGAVSLRQSGGFYFVPQASVERWNKLRAGVQACSKHTLHQIAAMRTKDAVDAILSAITAETEQACEEFCKDIQDVGKRALETRELKTNALLEKVDRYEGILGEKLDGLRTAVERTRAALATAILLAGQPDPE